jgi:transcriptional regulator with XRE-family HTH domain
MVHMTISIQYFAPSNSVDALIGERLRELRTERGLTASGMANALAVTEKRINGFEQGTARIRARELFVLAALLDAPISAFVRNL